MWRQWVFLFSFNENHVSSVWHERDKWKAWSHNPKRGWKRSNGRSNEWIRFSKLLILHPYSNAKGKRGREEDVVRCNWWNTKYIFYCEEVLKIYTFTTYDQWKIAMPVIFPVNFARSLTFWNFLNFRVKTILLRLYTDIHNFILQFTPIGWPWY